MKRLPFVIWMLGWFPLQTVGTYLGVLAGEHLTKITPTLAGIDLGMYFGIGILLWFDRAALKGGEDG